MCEWAWLGLRVYVAWTHRCARIENPGRGSRDFSEEGSNKFEFYCIFNDKFFDNFTGRVLFVPPPLAPSHPPSLLALLDKKAWRKNIKKKWKKILEKNEKHWKHPFNGRSLVIEWMADCSKQQQQLSSRCLLPPSLIVNCLQDV